MDDTDAQDDASDDADRKAFNDADNAGPTACRCVSARYLRGVAVSSVSQASPRAIASRSRIVRFSAFSRAISSCALASRAWSEATVARSAAGKLDDQSARRSSSGRQRTNTEDRLVNPC